MIELQSRSVGSEDYRTAGLAFEIVGVYSGRAAAWRTTGDSLAIQYWNRQDGATYHLINSTAGVSGIVYLWVSGESRQLRVTASPAVCVEEMKADSATAHRYLVGHTPTILQGDQHGA